MIDLYCERTAPGFWAEPVNAITNLAFIAAGWALWRLAAGRRALTPGIRLLIFLTAAIGIGSFLFHTFAAPWSRTADLLPVLLFQLVFIWIYCRMVAGLKTGYTAGLMLTCLLTASWTKHFTHLLNGSLFYAPALFVLLAFGIYHCISRKENPFLLLGAGGVFLLSLTLRTLDTAACPYFPAGTHFIWHLLNAAVLFLVIKALISNANSS